MKERVPYISWRDSLASRIPEARRIGEDFLVFDRDDFWDPGVEPFMLDIVLAIVFTGGGGRISINMVDYELTAPSLLVIVPDVVVKLESPVGDDTDFFAIAMSRKFTDSLFTDSGITTPLKSLIFKSPVRSIAGQEDAFEMYRMLLLRLIGSKVYSSRLDGVKHLTLAFFYGCTIADHPFSVGRNLSRSEHIAETFLKLAKEHYREEKSLAYYAAAICITPKYLSAAVKEATGKNASEWIDDYLVCEAKALLSSTTLSVDDISIRLGFLSQSLFGKFFKREAALSPSEYRHGLVVSEHNFKDKQ